MDGRGPRPEKGHAGMIAQQPQKSTASDTLTIRGVRSPVEGRITVPGDKSISHRAVILGSIAEGTTRIRNFLPANDCLATLDAVRALGVQIEYGEVGAVREPP